MPVVEMTGALDAAGAVPVDLDVAVIMQRQLSHEQCLSSDSVHRRSLQTFQFAVRRVSWLWWL